MTTPKLKNQRRRIPIRCGKCGKLIGKNYKASPSSRTLVLPNGLRFRIVNKAAGEIDILCPDEKCGGKYRTTFLDIGMEIVDPSRKPAADGPAKG